jgi:hypothetical protein
MVISLRLSQFPFSGKELTAEANGFTRSPQRGAIQVTSPERSAIAAKTLFGGWSF